MKNCASIYGSYSMYLDPHHFHLTFWWNTVREGGVGAMETAEHRGIRHAICHQVPFTLGACQSKQKTCLWSSANSLECLHTPKSAPPNLLSTPSGLHTSTPLILPCTLLLSLCSSFPLVIPLLKSAVHCPQKLSPYPSPLISVSS